MKRTFIIVTTLLIWLPLFVIGALRFLPPPATAFMLQSEVWPIRYEWVPAERIADSARKAVVAAEDQKFWQHKGFDLEAITEAYEDNQKRRRKRGASTISQQTAKNLFLWPGGGYLRKGIEAYLTGWLELLWPKERILEVYLNVAEFGPGIYGVEAAARGYFGKTALELQPAEAARLAAVLPNPKRLSAASPGEYVLVRTNWIMGQMGYRPAVEEPEEIAEMIEEAAEEAEEAAEEAAEAREEALEEAQEAMEEAQEAREEAAEEDYAAAPPEQSAPETIPQSSPAAEGGPAPSADVEGEEVPEAPTEPAANGEPDLGPI